jgi:class 3 adenylate cyclase
MGGGAPVSGLDPTGRLDQAVAAFIRQELGAPVAGIIGFIDILLEDVRRDGLDDLAADLERMRLAAVQLNALIAEIVGGNAPGGEEYRSNLRHELRTPLSAIKGYGEILVEQARENGREPLLLDLAKVLDLADRLLGEIDRIADFRAETTNRDAAPSTHIVRDVLRTVAPLGGAAAPLPRALPSRILVVDDNAANRDLLSRRLLRDGHLVTTAENGTIALNLAESESFDLVVLDLMMPGLSGFEVLSQLKSDDRTRDIPVVMISALDELDSTVRCIEAGAEDYLAKPFNPVLLRARINASLEKKLLRDRERAAAEQLRAEKERSEALLLNILPRSIVERLRQGETVIADRISEATILFSDLVDFTALAAKLAPEQMVELLGSLFSRFDAIAAQLGLEKIKTIGDGYMVAGGLPQPRADHAVAVAEMALAMHDAADGTAVTYDQPIRLRIGIHTGALVAGVIGTHKFVYDVWGDTVNTAKRMETYGLPGRIHVSAATQQILGDAFRFERRGAREIKGKGRMETFFLDRP